MASNSTPGILYVNVQPKASLPPAQFHDWYNNEHGHLRVRLPFFVNGTLYKATDLDPSEKTFQKPEWLATYDVADIKHLSEPSYTSLKPNGSPREKAMLSEITIGRYLYDLVSSREREDFLPTEATDFKDVDGFEAKGRVLVAVSMSLTSLEDAEDHLNSWYEDEHIPLLMKIPGWLRTRRFKTSPLTPENPVEYVSLHEYDPINGLGGPEHKAAMDTPWRTIIREKYVASGGRRTYITYYVFGPAPRDLTTLSKLPSTTIATESTKPSPPSWEDPSKQTRTWTDEYHPVIESFITTPDGISIPYRLEGTPTPSAPTILFCNPILTTWSFWDTFLLTPFGHSLSQKYRILRYNTRGRTKLPPTATPISLDVATQDILTLLSHLRIPRVGYLIGVSMGGITTLNFCLQYPDKVGKFIACDFDIVSAPTEKEDWASLITTALTENNSKAMEKVSAIIVNGCFLPSPRGNAAEKERVRKLMEGNDAEGFVEQVKVFYDYDLRGRKCGVPGLLVVGSEDDDGPVSMAGFAGEISGTLDVKVVQGAAHFPMVERVDGFVDAIRGFLE